MHLRSGTDDVRLEHGFDREDGPTVRQSVSGGSSERRPHGTRGPLSASPPAATGAVDDDDDDNRARTAGRRPAGAEIPEDGAVGEIAPRESRPGVEEAATDASFFSLRSDRGRSRGPVFFLSTVPQTRVCCAKRRCPNGSRGAVVWPSHAGKLRSLVRRGRLCGSRGCWASPERRRRTLRSSLATPMQCRRPGVRRGAGHLLPPRRVSKPVSLRASVLSPDVGTGQERRSSGWTQRRQDSFFCSLFSYCNTHLAPSLCISLL